MFCTNSIVQVWYKVIFLLNTNTLFFWRENWLILLIAKVSKRGLPFLYRHCHCFVSSLTPLQPKSRHDHCLSNTQVSSTSCAPKALQVEHFGFRAHHLHRRRNYWTPTLGRRQNKNSYKVVFGEHCLAGGAAGAVKSEELQSSVQMSYYPYSLSNAYYS